MYGFVVIHEALKALEAEPGLPGQPGQPGSALPEAVRHRLENRRNKQTILKTSTYYESTRYVRYATNRTITICKHQIGKTHIYIYYNL